MIVCTKCRVAKAPEEFSRRKTKRNGQDSWRKECMAAYRADHKEETRKYNAAWRTAHKEEARNYSTAYHATHKKEARAYRTAHPEKGRKRAAAYRARHPEKIRKRKAVYNAAHKEEGREYHVAYYAAYPEKERKRAAAWQQANPERWAILQARGGHKRRAREAQTPATLTAREWRATLAAFDHRCAYCGCEKARFHKDHVIPVAKGGGLEAGNIVPACSACNSSKNAHSVKAWMKRKGYDYERFAKTLSALNSTLSIRETHHDDRNRTQTESCSGAL